MNLDKLCGFETMCFRLKDRSYDFSDGAGGSDPAPTAEPASTISKFTKLANAFKAAVRKNKELSAAEVKNLSSLATKFKDAVMHRVKNNPAVDEKLKAAFVTSPNEARTMQGISLDLTVSSPLTGIGIILAGYRKDEARIEQIEKEGYSKLVRYLDLFMGIASKAIPETELRQCSKEAGLTRKAGKGFTSCNANNLAKYCPSGLWSRITLG